MTTLLGTSAVTLVYRKHAAVGPLDHCTCICSSLAAKLYALHEGSSQHASRHADSDGAGRDIAGYSAVPTSSPTRSVRGRERNRAVHPGAGGDGVADGAALPPTHNAVDGAVPATAPGGAAAHSTPELYPQSGTLVVLFVSRKHSEESRPYE